jgi:hypothetical protein
MSPLAFFEAKKDDPAASLKILSTRLDARYKPALEGWDAKIEYWTDPHDWLDCWWYHHQDPKKKWKPELALKIDFHPGNLIAQGDFGGTHYIVHVRGKNFARNTGKPMPIAEVCKVLATPESLRDHLVAAYTDQLKNIDDDTRADRGIVVEAAFLDPAIAPPVKGVPVASARSLTDDERKRLLKTASEQLNRQIAAVKNDFQALHAATRKAFPIRECLMEKKKDG